MALAAAAAVANPVRLFASGATNKGRTGKALGQDKMVLTFEPFEARMKHRFTIAGSSRSTTPHY